MGAFREDIGAVLDVVTGITPDNWDQAADIEGATIDRLDYNNPLSCKVYAELGDTTSGDEVDIEIQESDDGTTWEATLLGSLNPTHAEKTKSLDIKLTGAKRYIRAVADASDSTVATTVDIGVVFIFGGAKVRG